MELEPSLLGAGCVVLIGPAAVGKSTVGPLVARTLGLDFIDLDAVAGPFYVEAGKSLETLQARIVEMGVPTAHRWWQPARLHAVRRLLETTTAAVVALGAGHSHYEDSAYYESVRKLLTGHWVVLLAVAPEVGASVEVLRRRSLASKRRDWIADGIDFLEMWASSTQNADLADVVVYTAGKSAEEVAAAVVQSLPDGLKESGRS